MSDLAAGPDWTPLIVAVAPNGARKTKADHPAVPVNNEDMARCAAECADAGAAMLHLHVRDRRGGHVLDADLYLDAISKVEAEVGDRLLIQITSEAVGRYTPAEQMAVVRAVRPDAVSLAVRELVPGPDDEAEAARFLADTVTDGTLPQYILYSPEDVARFGDLVAREVVPSTPASVLFVLGRYTAGQQSAPADLLPFLAAWQTLDLALPWFVCAFGATENACALTAAALGGHSRVGFENNTLLRDGTTAADNAALVAQVRSGADALGRPIGDADAARRMMA